MSKNQLDLRQTEVIQANYAKLCVVAPPGSGKTFTLIERIAYLIEHDGVVPDSILAITFTNRAAQELEARIRKRLPDAKRIPTAMTFHAFALSCICQNSRENQTLLVSDPERIEIIKQVAKQLGWRAKDLSLFITKAKAFYPQEERNQAYDAYNSELEKRNKADLDDILVRAFRLISEDADLREKLRAQYRHIFVDEYQDVSPIQVRLLQLLHTPTSDLFVIGDPNQAIYSFRGGLAASFMNFKATFGGAIAMKLKTNFRSTRNIIQASHAVLESTEESPETSNEQGEPIKLVFLADQKREAYWLIRTIRVLLGGTDLNSATSGDARTYHTSEIGIIYRLNAVGNLLERYFTESDIPFQRIGTKSLFEFEDVRSVIESLKTRGVMTRLSPAMKEIIDESAVTGSRLQLLLNFAVAYDALPPREALSKFLFDTETARGMDTPRCENTVTLLTAHAAKGLEFSVVFIVGAEDEFFPYIREGELANEARVEEERRLLYVAMTRAREQLFLTRTATRMRFGKTYAPRRSRFLRAIPKDLAREIAVTSMRKEESRQAPLF